MGLHLIAVQADNRKTSFNRCGGSINLGAGNRPWDYSFWGNLHPKRFSGSFSVSVSFRTLSLCFPENLSTSLTLGSLFLPLCERKANYNPPVMSRMMRLCAPVSPFPLLWPKLTQFQLLTLFSPELVARYFPLGAHPSLPVCLVVSSGHLVVSLTWFCQCSQDLNIEIGYTFGAREFWGVPPSTLG